MSQFSEIKHKANLPSLWMGAGTVFAGTAAAAIRGNMEILPASLCLIFVVFVQLTSNFYHAWHEMHSEEESIFARQTLNYVPDTSEATPLMTRLMREAAVMSFMISAMVGLALLTIVRVELWWWVILVGVLIYAEIPLSHVGKIKLIGTPWAMVITFLFFGPIGVFSTCMIQSQVEVVGDVWNFFDASTALFMAPACGFMALSSHYIFSFFNYKANPNLNKWNLTGLITPLGMELMIFANGLLMLWMMLWMMVQLDFAADLFAFAPTLVGFIINTVIAVRLRRVGLAEVNQIYHISVANYTLLWLLTLICFICAGDASGSFYRYML